MSDGNYTRRQYGDLDESDGRDAAAVPTGSSDNVREPEGEDDGRAVVQAD